MPAVAPQRPIALARSARSVYTFEISERVVGEDHRGAETHEAAGDDQLAGGVGEAAGDAGGSEHDQAGEQESLAAEAVAEAAGGQQQRREHQVVGVDDPLQLRVRRMQLANKRRERDVDDGRVQHHHQLRGCQNRQRDEAWRGRRRHTPGAAAVVLDPVSTVPAVCMRASWA